MLLFFACGGDRVRTVCLLGRRSSRYGSSAQVNTHKNTRRPSHKCGRSECKGVAFSGDRLTSVAVHPPTCPPPPTLALIQTYHISPPPLVSCTALQAPLCPAIHLPTLGPFLSPDLLVMPAAGVAVLSQQALAETPSIYHLTDDDNSDAIAFPSTWKSLKHSSSSSQQTDPLTTAHAFHQSTDTSTAACQTSPPDPSPRRCRRAARRLLRLPSVRPPAH